MNITKAMVLLVALLGIIAAVLVLSSCEEETPITCPVYDIGAVEGHILISGEGVLVEVGARAQEGLRRGEVIARTFSDTTGWYRMELPTGLYMMEINPSGGMSISSDMQDTIRVTPNVHHFNLEFGRAEVRIHMPEAFNERSLGLRLYGSAFNSRSYYGDVQDGLVQFSIPAVRLGPYTMSLTIPNANGRFYLPGTYDLEAADSLLVVAHEVVDYEADFSHEYASISGQVSGSWQEADVSWPHIIIYSAENRALGIKTCSEDGLFTLEFILPQEVRLAAKITGIVQWFGGDSFETATVFDLQAGDNITGVSIFESGVEILLQGPGSMLEYDPTIFVVDEAGHEYFLPSYDNPFIVCNLQPGKYYMKVDGHCNNQAWQSSWYDGSDTLEDATPFDLVEGELLNLTMSLTEGGHINGTVHEISGESIGPASCKIVHANGEPLCADSYGYTRIEDGRFDFRGLADGDYYIAVNYYPCGVSWYPGSANFSEAHPITIIDHGSVTDLNWSISDCSKEAK